MAIRVAVDAMGGDKAPSVVVEGAIRALEASGGDLEVLLVGQEDALQTEIAQRKGATDLLPLHIVHAPDVIAMDEAPAAAVKSKRGSSIHVGLGAVREGRAHGFVSAGNTGAIMAASLFILGSLQGVARPSVVSFFPTTKGHCIILDVGTNVDCRPEHLLQFARMGSIYASTVMQLENPRVALVNLGEEARKGNEQVKAAYKLLQASPGINFCGNIEGRDILHHMADVVVCDGFVGNILLKFGESVASAFPQMIAEEMEQQAFSDPDKKMVRNVLSAVRLRFSYEEYGGAPLLGVNGNVMIGHGGSTVRAIERIILMAADVARHGALEAMNKAFGK